jgi:hypothetical protein
MTTSSLLASFNAAFIIFGLVAIALAILYLASRRE